MKETFRVSIVNTKTQSRTDMDSNAVTLSDLKSELSERGIDYSGMTFMEGSTKVELKDDSSILPTNVPVKRNGVATGETTNDLVFFLTTPNKNIKSGAMTRAEAYAFMKENPEFAVAFKTENGGKNYTNATTSAIVEFIENFNRTSEEAPLNDAHECNCQSVFDNVLAYATSLKNANVLTQDQLDAFVDILNGEPAPKVAVSSYSNEDIDNMYGSWMK